jgi:hypothetical protein
MLLAPLLDSIGTLLGVMYGDIGCCGSDAMDLASWRYSLSTQSAVGGGEAFKGLASVASVCPPPLTVGGESRSLGLSLGGDEVHH